MLFRLARAFEEKLRRQNEFLKVENELLRGRVRKKRICLELHADRLWQCDVFSKRNSTLEGPRQVFALVFINVAMRRVFVNPSTQSTNGDWMREQATAFPDRVNAEQIDCIILMRDLGELRFLVHRSRSQDQASRLECAELERLCGALDSKSAAGGTGALYHLRATTLGLRRSRVHRL